MNRAQLQKYASENLIDAIRHWAASADNFDLAFVESVSEYLDEHDEISDAQRRALENIIIEWEIPVTGV